MVHPKFFLAKSLKSATWTCLLNMVSLAQWEVGPTKFCDYDDHYAYNQPILMANSWQAKANELSETGARYQYNIVRNTIVFRLFILMCNGQLLLC